MSLHAQKDKRVLIYDDDPDILEICSIILQSKGYAVDTRNTCSDIVGDAAALRPSVILIDNWLPGGGGVQAVQLLKQSSFVHIPVVFFSANTEVEQLAAKAGADFVLKKPFDIRTLENTVAAACSGTRSL